MKKVRIITGLNPAVLMGCSMSLMIIIKSLLFFTEPEKTQLIPGYLRLFMIATGIFLAIVVSVHIFWPRLIITRAGLRLRFFRYLLHPVAENIRREDINRIRLQAMIKVPSVEVSDIELFSNYLQMKKEFHKAQPLLSLFENHEAAENDSVQFQAFSGIEIGSVEITAENCNRPVSIETASIKKWRKILPLLPDAAYWQLDVALISGEKITHRIFHIGQAVSRRQKRLQIVRKEQRL